MMMMTMTMIAANSGKYAHTQTPSMHFACQPTMDTSTKWLQILLHARTQTSSTLFVSIFVYYFWLSYTCAHRVHTRPCARALPCHFIMTLNHKKPPEISKHRRNFYDAFTFARSLYALLVLLRVPIPVPFYLSFPVRCCHSGEWIGPNK